MIPKSTAALRLKTSDKNTLSNGLHKLQSVKYMGGQMQTLNDLVPQD